VDRLIDTLFAEGGSVQSYGQRDRHFLFTIFKHTVDVYGPQLATVDAQKPLLLFIRATTGSKTEKI
jgi:hypothetical protein